MAKRATSEYNLAVVFPELTSEWHPRNNGSLRAELVTPGSGINIWWKCQKGHEWQASAAKRSAGRGCPYCGGRRACKENSLLSRHPAVAKEWHPTKNRLRPSEVTAGSGRVAWWLCEHKHSWRAIINHQRHGGGCPICARLKIASANSLETKRPLLALQWHPTKNRLLPSDVRAGSNKSAWWLCAKKHEWKERVTNRWRGSGCPICRNRRYATADSSLEAKAPLLSLQWHPTKNGDLQPRDVTRGSSKKVWWVCLKGHEWPAVIAKRTGGDGCPKCFAKTSSLELRLYSELKAIFKGARHRDKTFGKEADIFLPGINTAIEIDGRYWHRNRSAEDRGKVSYFQRKGIQLLRVREQGLPRLSKTNVFFSARDSELVTTQSVFRAIKGLAADPKLRRKIDDWLRGRHFANEREYQLLVSASAFALPGTSLLERRPDVAKQWHPKLNSPLTANQVTFMSSIKAWWLCSRGHEWQAPISDRSSGRGCAYCSGRRASSSHCLSSADPLLAQEWHPIKNGILKPSNMTPSSGRVVWWLCSKGHAWQCSIHSRRAGVRCYECTKMGLIPRSLLVKYPELAKEFHPVKNGGLSPRDIAGRSGKQFWWQCHLKHEWRATAANRSGGRGCPYCGGKKIIPGNSLGALRPDLAKEWLKKINSPLTPFNVAPFSGKKVWWECRRSHHWRAVISSRTNGTGCPSCYRLRKTGSNRAAR